MTGDVAILHVTGVTAALSSAAAEAVAFSVESAHQRGVTVSLDVNFRSRLWPEAAARKALRPLLPSVDILFASEDELMLVAAEPATQIDAAARQIIADGPATVVVKRGGAGATAYSAAGKLNAPTPTVPVVDVVGAGGHAGRLLRPLL